MPIETPPKVLILTPVKDAVAYLGGYSTLLETLDWPKARLALGLLESDSVDGTFDQLEAMRPRLEARADRVTLIKRDFGFRMPEALPRWTPAFQVARRQTLARSRNHLLFEALGDADWVLWLDVDIVAYPADILHTLLSYECDILQPNCVTELGGPSFDTNGWMDGGRSHLHDKRGATGPVRMQSVGGTMLLVRGDLHRDGLVFPTFKYGVQSPNIRQPHPLWGAGEIETEGLAMMAADMGIQCWGLPDCEIIHASD